jgi:hypothetical protein
MVGIIVYVCHPKKGAPILFKIQFPSLQVLRIRLTKVNMGLGPYGILNLVPRKKIGMSKFGNYYFSLFE